jgi:hypothetical protein
VMVHRLKHFRIPERKFGTKIWTRSQRGGKKIWNENLESPDAAERTFGRGGKKTGASEPHWVPHHSRRREATHLV